MDQILEFLNELNELLTNASGLTGEYNSIMDMFNEILLNTTGLTASFTAFIAIIISLIELLIGIVGSSVGFIAVIGTTIVSCLTFLAFYLVDAIPLTVIAKKAKCKGKWLAWIPFFQDKFCLYLLSRIPGKQDFQLGKFRFKERNMAILIYLLVTYFGGTLVNVLFAILNMIPAIGPVLGAFTLLLHFIPNAICAIIEFVYLRDVLDMLKPDKKSNRITAWAVSILDCFLTFGWAKRIYLITLMGKKPLEAEQTAEQPEQLSAASI